MNYLVKFLFFFIAFKILLFSNKAQGILNLFMQSDTPTILIEKYIVKYLKKKATHWRIILK